MKRINYTITAILFLVIVLSGCSSSNASNAAKMGAEKGNKAVLQYNPKVGKSGTMVMTMDMDMEMEMMGQKMNTEQNIEMASNMEVIENAAETIKTKMVYQYFAMAMDIPMMGKVEYDSRKEDNEGMLAESMGAVMGDLMKQEMIMVQSRTGKTINIEGSEVLSNLQQGGGSFNMNTLMGMSQFPEKPIAIGNSWNKKINDNSMPMAFDATYTLKDIRDGKVYIDITADVSSNPNYVAEADNETPAPEVSGTQSGTMIYEQGTMWFIEGILNQDFDMKVSQMGMEIPMKLTSNIIMSME